MITESNGNLVLNALNALIDSTQEFTDSLYISNDQRERIIRLQNEIRDQTLLFLRDTNTQDQSNADSSNTNNSNTNSAKFNRLYNCTSMLNDCEVLKKLLQTQTMQLANNLFKENQDATLLNCIKTYSLSNHYDLLIETLDKFKEYSDHVLEVCLDISKTLKIK